MDTKVAYSRDTRHKVQDCGGFVSREAKEVAGAETKTAAIAAVFRQRRSSEGLRLHAGLHFLHGIFFQLSNTLS